MSGVVDENGQQWQHCHGCDGFGTTDYSPRGKWVRIEDLEDEEPSERYKFGRDLCPKCYRDLPLDRKGLQVLFRIDTAKMLRRDEERRRVARRRREAS